MEPDFHLVGFQNFIQKWAPPFILNKVDGGECCDLRVSQLVTGYLTLSKRGETPRSGPMSRVGKSRVVVTFSFYRDSRPTPLPCKFIGVLSRPDGRPCLSRELLVLVHVGCTKCTKCELCKMGAHEGDGEEARKGRVSQCSPVTGPLTLPRANQSLMTLCNQFSLHQCHPQVHGHTRPSSSSNGR
jgi:hypothetical protein